MAVVVAVVIQCFVPIQRPQLWTWRQTSDSSSKQTALENSLVVGGGG
jgi:hypothetical protein